MNTIIGSWKIPVSINVLVKKEYLLNLEDGHEQYVEGKIVYINSYTDHQPTFDVHLNDGSVYCYLPVNALSTQEINTCKEDILDCLVVCPSEYFICFSHEELETKHCQVFDEYRKWHGFGKLLLTLEWPKDNILVHLIELESGQFCFVQNTKILFTDKRLKQPTLPDWKKLRKEWK